MQELFVSHAKTKPLFCVFPRDFVAVNVDDLPLWSFDNSTI